MVKNNIVGYVEGIFDILHIGHINILRNAKSMCDKLIVGVLSDDYLKIHLKKEPIHNIDYRTEVIRSLKMSDVVIVVEDTDKIDMFNRLKFEILFVGEDWKVHARKTELEKFFQNANVRIIQFPYTNTTSSKLVNEILEEERRHLQISKEKQF